MGAYGISEDTTRDLLGKPQAEIIDHLYAEVDKCSEGDIHTVRTLLVALLAASMVGLDKEEVVAQLTRIIKLLRLTDIKVTVEQQV